MWRLVLGLFKRGRRLVSRIPSKRGLELGHSSGSEPVILPATLICLSENGERLEAIDRFFH